MNHGAKCRYGTVTPPREKTPAKYPLKGFDNIAVALKAATERTKGAK